MLQPSNHGVRPNRKLGFDIFKHLRWLRVLGSLMILLVLGLIGAAYATVFVSYGPRILHGRPLDKLLATSVIVSFAFLVRAYLHTRQARPTTS